MVFAWASVYEWLLLLYLATSVAAMDSTFHITDTLTTAFYHWAIKGLKREYISYETLALTTEPSEASIESTIHITETLVLTTEPSEASMNSTFHIPETLALTNETWNVLYNLEVMGSIPYFS